MLRRFWPHIVILLSSLVAATSLYARYRQERLKNTFHHNAGYVLTARAKEFAHTFRFTNNTNALINFRKLIRSCECTTATSDTMSVKPSGSANITMAVHLPSVLRQNNLYCTIETDSPVYPKLQYQLDFFTLPSIVVEPSTLSIGASASERTADDRGTRPSEAEVTVSLFFDSVKQPPQAIRAEVPPHLVVKSTEIQQSVNVQAGVYKTQARFSVAVNSEYREVPGGIAYLNLDAGTGFRASVPITVKSNGEPSVVMPGSINFGVVSSPDEPSIQTFIVQSMSKQIRITADSPQIVINELEATSTHTKFSATLVLSAIEKGSQSAKGIFSGAIKVDVDHGKSYKVPGHVLIR